MAKRKYSGTAGRNPLDGASGAAAGSPRPAGVGSVSGGRAVTGVPSLASPSLASMTLDALCGSAPIYANHLAGGFPLVLMALGAGYVPMVPVQHERRFIVIERFPVPARRDMTLPTVFRRPALELTGVSVLGVVAIEALGGGLGELRRHLGRSAANRFGRLVALDAFHVEMGAVNLKLGFGVIEGADFFPLLGGVAALTGQFGLVWIGVTRVAGSGSEVILARHSYRRTSLDRCQRQRCTAGREWLVALVAGYGGVLSGECELCFRVARNGKRGGLEAGGSMALVALVGVGRGGELSAVAVGMAGGADELAGNVHRAAALGLMTFGATEVGMFAFERERGFAVRFAVKFGGLEACQVVTG